MALKDKLPESKRCKYSADEECEFQLNTDGETCESTNLTVPVQTQSKDSSQASDHDADEALLEEKCEKPAHIGHSGTEASLDGPAFTLCDTLIGVLSIAFFYFDLITDILLARDYFYQENLLAFYLTTAFITGPSLITCMLNFRWYHFDYQYQQENRGNENVKQTPMILWLIRIVLTLLMMGPVIRQFEYIYNGLKSNCNKLSSKEKQQHYFEMRNEGKDACCIRMLECFYEAASQLVLQIYILTQEESWTLEGTRAVAMLSSWASLSWCMVAYQNSLRYSHKDKENLTKPAMIISFLWRACEIGPRVISLGLFAALCHYYVFIIVGIHWMAMSLWLICQKTQFYHNRCEEKLFNILCGYVLVFCFLNVKGDTTRYKMLVYYIIIFIENWTMMGLWLHFTSDKSQWFYIPTILVVSLGVILQLCFQLTYYRCFHPLGREKIPCCLKRGEYTCYQLLCYKKEENETENHENPNTAGV